MDQPTEPRSPQQRSRSSLALWANMAVIYVVWGSTYFGIAIAIATMPPFLMAAIRFAIAGALLLAWDLIRSPATRHLPTARQVLDSFIVGGLLLGIGNGFVVFGEKTVPSGIAAILIAMTPLWFATFGWLYLRERLPRIVALAIAIGFLGTALLIWPSGEGANRFDALGILMLLLADLGWAHGSIYSVRRAKLPSSPLTASGLQMLAGAAVAGFEALLTGEPAQFRPEAISIQSILAVAYLVVFGSMLTFTSYAWLLRKAPLSLIGTYAYVNPIVAVALGTVFLHEPIGPRTIVATAIILVAVAIIVTTHGRMASAVAAGADPEAVDLGSPDPGGGLDSPRRRPGERLPGR